MYNVLITDDEPTIREGLRTLIDWEALGYAVVDTAANGKDALGKIAVYRPDLLIVDIRMPGMTGLELVEAVRQTGDKLRVLILSGYADFDYAKKAIGLDIDGYLLKPVDEDELVGHLDKLKSVLDRERKERADSGSRKAWSRQKLLHDLLSPDAEKRVLPDADELKAMDLGWDSYGIVLIKLEGSDRSMEPGRFAAVRDRFAQAYDAKDKGVVVAMDAALVLLLPDDLSAEAVKRRVYADLAALIAEPCARIAAASGPPASRIGDVRMSYLAAAALLDRRFFHAGGQLIDSSSPALHAVPGGIAEQANWADDVPALAEKLYFALDVGNLAVVSQLVADTGRGLIRRGKSEADIKAAFAGIVTALAGKLSRSGDERELDNERLSACMSTIYGHVRYDELEQELIAVLPTLLKGSGSCSGDKQIKKMIDLIRRNYVENLKLETLAEVFNYNSAYLGKLFKSETGEYFNTYLDKVRIEKAKELLDQGLKVYQVAEKVGYANVDYFHGKFRKYVGVSPTSYRKK
ncbi:response regulator transcription factor [Paenibacillus glycinis]|uniref:Response regulator n=1 Tax=Paenibacillus glycinis TaxID=2697035 RepID=A0ABW9XW57_9BACL|nr:response regulator transcription factor [Paenibacillus glycinis]NBD26949.1 response regulator [Paenibacillus glycinis]